ncbi:hypothetical protein NDU88_003775 [Pleurodeles waltl]|uniref:Uncharacterized protein n=1 Tax=Pleurodeles waltl TaxID=8319 RepID=A0AAV7PFK3_PLEWA|nr:hypothetical protein NDU88_003775 [Pleurodeles waltl]
MDSSPLPAFWRAPPLSSARAPLHSPVPAPVRVHQHSQWAPRVTAFNFRSPPLLRASSVSPAATANAAVAILFSIFFPGTPEALAQRRLRGGRIARDEVASNARSPPGRIPVGSKQFGELYALEMSAGPRSRPRSSALSLQPHRLPAMPPTEAELSVLAAEEADTGKESYAD